MPLPPDRTRYCSPSCGRTAHSRQKALAGVLVLARNPNPPGRGAGPPLRKGRQVVFGPPTLLRCRRHRLAAGHSAPGYLSSDLEAHSEDRGPRSSRQGREHWRMEPLKGYSLPCLLSQVGDDLDRFAIVVSDAYRDHNGGFWYLEGNPSSDIWVT